jgi:glycosyltransferase involved in cell wall biosynthesis
VTKQRLSVVLCTYNGWSFLDDQLRSIGEQTRLPDELVVSDDASTDDTAELVHEFAARAPFPVRMHVNERNIGTRKNFEQAIGLAEGEVIALANQDDVWLPEKLERTETLLTRSSDIGLVFTDAMVVDDHLNPTGRSMFELIPFQPEARRKVREGSAFEVLLAGNVVQDPTSAFWARFRSRIFPLPKEWMHDHWIALVVSMSARLDFIEEPMMLYRQHGGSQLGAPAVRSRGLTRFRLEAETFRNRDRALYSHEIRALEVLRERLLDLGTDQSHRDPLSLVEDKLKHIEARSQMPASFLRRLGIVATELASGRYRRYSRGLLSAARDLLFRE